MIHLKDGNNEAGVTPNGACLSYWRIDGRDILRPSPSDDMDPLNSAFFPCTPYFGRIQNPVYWDDQSYSLQPTHRNADPNHPIHGHGWMRKWNVRDQGADHVSMEIADKQPQKGDFPLGWSSNLDVRIAKNQLQIKLDLANHHDKPAPFGLGLHPFFPRESSTGLIFSAKSLHIPPGMADIGLGADAFENSASLPGFSIDHTFCGWNGVTAIKYKSRMLMIKSNAPFLHIYAPSGSDFFCLEPITQLPGAFNTEKIDENLIVAPSPNNQCARTLSMTIEQKAIDTKTEFIPYGSNGK